MKTYAAHGYEPSKQGFSANNKKETYSGVNNLLGALSAWLFFHQQHNERAEANYMGICNCPDCGTFMIVQEHEVTKLAEVAA